MCLRLGAQLGVKIPLRPAVPHLAAAHLRAVLHRAVERLRAIHLVAVVAVRTQAADIAKNQAYWKKGAVSLGEAAPLYLRRVSMTILSCEFVSRPLGMKLFARIN